MNILKFFVDLLVQIFLSLVGPIILVVIGALIAGYGLHREWEWMTNGGVIVAALGVLLFTRIWWFSD